MRHHNFSIFLASTILFVIVKLPPDSWWNNVETSCCFKKWYRSALHSISLSSLLTVFCQNACSMSGTLDKKKEIPYTLWEVRWWGISQMPNSAWVNPAFQVEKGITVHNKFLRLHYNCLWQQMLRFICDECLGGRSWHRSITQLTHDPKIKGILVALKAYWNLTIFGTEKNLLN